MKIKLNYVKFKPVVSPFRRVHVFGESKYVFDGVPTYRLHMDKHSYYHE